MKKIFTLLTLLLCAITSTWATTTVYSYTCSSQDNTDGTYDATGGKFTVGVAKKYEADKGIKLDGDSGTKWVQITLSEGSTLQVGDVITIQEFASSNPSGTDYGVAIGTTNFTPIANLYLPSGAKNVLTDVSYTVVADDGLEGESSFYAFRCSGKSTYINAVTITREAPTNAPFITTQPASATYKTGETATALTVEATASAGELSYQWFCNTTESEEGATAIEGATTYSYVPSTTDAGITYYYCVVTDDNGTATSCIVSIEVSDASAPTIAVEASATSVAKNETVTLTATTTGYPIPTIQWYSNTSASTEGGTAVDGANAETYTVPTGNAGTYYFYAIATNSEGAATSDVQTIIVTLSNDCALNQVVYSNSFDAFIKAPTAESGTPGEESYVAAANGTIKAWYMEGEDLPTISSVNVSDGATYAVEGNQLTVTAEDGTTTAVYDITVESVSPYTGIGNRIFDGSETSWIKTGNAFSTEDGKKGWKFSKNDTNWERETPGKNRIYFFLAASDKVTFTSGGTNRNINVYRNGELLSTPTSTGAANATFEIKGNAENPYMIAIVSNQTSGDGAIKAINITKNVSVNVSVTITSCGYATLISNNALDFSNAGGATAYIVKDNDISDNAITLTPVTKVPANTGLVIAGTVGETYSIPATSDETDDVAGNLMVGNADNDITIVANQGYILAASDGLFHPCSGGTLAKGKAYLKIDVTTGAKDLAIDFGEGTGINNVNVNENESGKIFNLAGQQMKSAVKGVYIKNGKKYIK